jgi:hypothetical protein
VGRGLSGHRAMVWRRGGVTQPCDGVAGEQHTAVGAASGLALAPQGDVQVRLQRLKTLVLG